MTVVGYARTSLREEQIMNQVKAIKDRYGDIPIFLDEGVSGIVPAKQRKGFSALLRFIEENGGIEDLVVFELSRIGRNFLETLQLVIELEHKGVRVVSVSPQESWTTMENKGIRQLIMMIFAWVAEMERKNLIERTKEGIRRARSEGNKR